MPQPSAAASVIAYRAQRASSPSRARRGGLLREERQDVGVQLLLVLPRDAVRSAGVDLQLAVLDELDALDRGIRDRNDLVVVAMREEDRHVERLQVVGEVGLRERGDAVVGGLES